MVVRQRAEPFPELPIAVGAVHVGRGGVPVVAGVVDEAEAQPDRIGKIDAGHRARIGRMAEDAVGGKGVELVRLSLVLPATGRAGLAAYRRRIECIEFRLHEAIDVRWHLPLEHVAGLGRQKNVLALRDGGGGDDERQQSRDGDDHGGRQPAPGARADASAEDQHRGDQQQRVSRQVVHRQSDGHDRQRQRRHPQPGMARRASRRFGCRRGIDHVLAESGPVHHRPLAPPPIRAAISWPPPKMEAPIPSESAG